MRRVGIVVGVEIEEGFHRANFARWCRVLTYVTRRAGMRRREGRVTAVRNDGGALRGCSLEGEMVGNVAAIPPLRGG